ncbi:MAG: ABC transporter ATP-binding protein, partial [Lachnospiraceae bacterium]|nr:ABC transporter ATP-binding protein [Lachnospiraceae bacterium]
RGIEYKIIDDDTADVYTDITFSEMAKAFEEKNATIIKMEEHDESLEAFYLALLGGEDNA